MCEEKLGGNVVTFYNQNSIKDKLRARHFYSNCLIFEHLCFEPTGSSLYFEQQNQVIKVCSECIINENLNFELVSKIQEYALQFLEEFKEVSVVGDFSSYRNVLNDFLDWPEGKVALVIGNLYDDDIDGSKKLLDLVDKDVNYNFFTLLRRVRKEKWRSGYIAAAGYPKHYLVMYNCIQVLLDFKNRLTL
jgi:hypothetical protein